MDSEARSKAIKVGVAGVLIVGALAYLVWAMQPTPTPPEELPSSDPSSPAVTNFKPPPPFNSHRANPAAPPVDTSADESGAE